ncbi:MAG: UDP-N-acetylmuramate dehydrogenase [Desulfomonilaceae bacterium]
MKISETQIQRIRSILGEDPLTGFPLKNLTSYRVGGPADVVAFPRNLESLTRLLLFAMQEDVRYFILGSGTNVLFHDDGFRGLIVSPLRMKALSIEKGASSTSLIKAQSGTPLSLVVSRACRSGLTGMESLWGIPGSIGGSVACNAGAGGVSVGDLITELELVNADGRKTSLGKGSLSYGYRFFNLPLQSIVFQASFELSSADPNEIQKKLENFKCLRRSTQPRGFPNAGCVFKNPSPDNQAGALIERLGFKATKCGGAEVSSVHANFIVNKNKAKAQDILNLIETITKAAAKRVGISLELEIRIIKPSENYV